MDNYVRINTFHKLNLLRVFKNAFFNQGTFSPLILLAKLPVKIKFGLFFDPSKRTGDFSRLYI